MRSISVSGNCAFVQTGVIGDCNRDGYRHSRVVKGRDVVEVHVLRLACIVVMLTISCGIL